MPRQYFRLDGLELQGQRAPDSPCQVVAQIHELGERLLKAFRPHLGLVAHLHQPGIHPDALPVASHTSFHEVVDVQLPTDLSHRFRGVFVGHCRSGGDHAHLLRLQLAKLGDDLIGKPVADTPVPARD